jgi:hypothetical protein
LTDLVDVLQNIGQEEINPRANFQQKILHPDFRPLTNITNKPTQQIKPNIIKPKNYPIQIKDKYNPHISGIIRPPRTNTTTESTTYPTNKIMREDVIDIQAFPTEYGIKFTTLKVTDVEPNIPDIDNTNIKSISPINRKSPRTLPVIEFPTKLKTSKTPIISEIKRPTTTGIGSIPRGPSLPGADDEIIRILTGIDMSRLSSTRTGKNKRDYTLKEIQNIAKSVGISVSGKKKGALIDDIKEMRRRYGLLGDES